MRRYIPKIFPILALSALSIPSVAQTFGSISGSVTDGSKAVLSGATITAENIANGDKRTTTTNSSGYFVFPSLQVGNYKVRVESPGFTSKVQEGIVVNAAMPVALNLTLDVGGVNQTVEVISSAPVLDTANAAIGATMQTEQISQLPINGRDYARLSLLTPGAVARSRYISDISFDGLHTVHNQFQIDGIDASRVDQPYMSNGFERGARLLTGSLDTIAEFRVQTSGYQAEYGRAAGSSVNIVTKSGTNLLHGTVYDYLRNDMFDARNFFARTVKPKIRFNDFGGNLGGPIFKDKSFFFANYEGSRQIIGIIGSGTVPSQLVRTQALTKSPSLAPILAAIPLGTSSTNNAQVDNYSVVKNTDVQENTGSIRIDHNFSSADSAFVRVNVNDSLTQGPLFGVTTTALGLSDRQYVPVRTTNIAIHEQHIFSPTFVNDFLAGMQRWASRIDSSTTIPVIAITGVDISPGSRGNSLSNNNSFQYGDTMTLVRGNHTIKWGGTAWRIQLNRNSINTATVRYTSINNFINNVVSQVSLTAGDPGHGTRATQIGLFVQDSYQMRRGLTINYGLRWDTETVPHDKNYATQSYDPKTGALMAAGKEYFNQNWKNFAPRLGIAYSPDEKTVVRASAGLFFQAYPVGFGAYNVPLNNVSGNLTLDGALINGLSYPYDSFVASGTQNLPNVYGFPTSKPDIYTEQWNLSVAREISKSTAIQLAYVGNHGVNLWRQKNTNLYSPALGRRPNTAFGNVLLQTNTGFSSYDGFQASLNQRLAHGLKLDANYSYGHVIDDVQDQGLFSSDPQDVNNIRAERGNGSGDVRHNFNFNFLYAIPMGAGHGFLGKSDGIVRTLASGWNISSLGMVRGGVAATVAYSGNSYGNANFTNQRPNVVPGVSRYVVHKSYRQYLNPNAWAVPAAGTFGNSPRNTIYGPGFAQIDMSMLKNTQISEKQTVEFRAEIFNIFNRANFAQPNTTFPSTSFGTIQSTYGNTIGFGTSRQIQFTLKYLF